MVTLDIDKDLSLRTLQPEDAVPLFALVDGNRTYLREWLPWVDANRTVEDSKLFIQNAKEQYENNLGFNAGIWHRGTLAGVVGFHRVDWTNRNVEIGYWLAEEFQGHGLVTKACKVLIDYAFDIWKLARVQIRCGTGNKRSCAIIERLGLIREGIARQAEFLYDHYIDLYVYGITAEEWKIVRSQSASKTKPSDVASIDTVVQALYECVTFPPGQKPDYARLRTLFVPGGTLVPPRNPKADSASVLTVAEFITRSDKYLAESDVGGKGFHEEEVDRTIHRFGNIAQVFSTFESKYSKTDRSPFSRGINSIQLVFDNDRWWVVSVAWDVERGNNRIPLEYLQNG